MILPNCNSKDPEVNRMFRLVDEKLSELYSTHGKIQLRDDMTFQNPPAIPASNRHLNANSIAKAWLLYDGFNHQIINSYNVAGVVVGPGAGAYIVQIKVRPVTEYPIIIVNASTTSPLAATASPTASGTQFEIAILSYTFAGVAADAYIYMVMFGD